MRNSLITIITSCLIMLVASETGLRDPKVTLTCSSGPTTNVVNVSWYPVHENYDTLEDMLSKTSTYRVRFQYCNFYLHCENGYYKTRTGCRRGKVDLSYEWGSVPKSENYCNVTIKYRDIYDSGGTSFSTTKNCYFENPVVNVSVTSVNTSIMGELMMLKCTVVTWSSLHDNVEIVWMTSNNESRGTTVQNINKSSVNNFTMYTDYYNISDLHLQDNGTEFSCQVEINSPLTLSRSSFILNLPNGLITATTVNRSTNVTHVIPTVLDNSTTSTTTMSVSSSAHIPTMSTPTSTPTITPTNDTSIPSNTSAPITMSTPTTMITPTNASTPTAISTPVNNPSGSVLVISTLISSTIIIITVVAIIIICGTILLRNWNRQTEQPCKNLPNLTTLDNDYYSIVGIEELSTCEDIDGIVLQVETEDDNKEEYKVFTDYSFMLRSMVSPMLTIDIKQKYEVSSQGNFQEIPSAENSPGAYIHVKESSFDIGDSAGENDDSDSTTTRSGSTPPQNPNLLSVDYDVVGQYVDDMSSVMVSGVSANTMISDQHLTVKSDPKSASEDHTYLYSNSEQSLSLAPRNGNSLEVDVEQCLQPILVSGEYLDILTAATQTDEPLAADDEDDTSKDVIRSTSATGEYATSGKFISSSEQILSQCPANDTLLNDIAISQLQSSASGEHLDYLSTAEQSLIPQRNSLRGVLNLGVVDIDDHGSRTNGNPVSVMNTLMLPTQQELHVPLKVSSNGCVEETEV